MHVFKWKNNGKKDDVGTGYAQHGETDVGAVLGKLSSSRRKAVGIERTHDQ